MQSSSNSVIDSEQLTTLASAAGLEAASAILDAFWKSNDDLLNLLRENIANQNFDEISKAAHALKGSAFNLGATQLAERAKSIEDAAKEADVSTAEGLIANLDTDVANAREAFQGLLGSITA